MEVFIPVVKETNRHGFEGMGEKIDGPYDEKSKHTIHRRPEQEEGFITVDRDEKITYVNKTLCRKLGYSQMQLVGESIRKVTVEKEFKRISELTGKRQDGLASSYIIELITRKGNSMLFRVSAAPLYSGEDFLGTMGIFSDITREKADLDSIIETIQYQELMVQYLPTGLLILASDGIVINTNPAFTKITGIQEDELRNRHILNLKFLESLSYRYLVENLPRFQVNFDHETDLIKMENGMIHILNGKITLDHKLSFLLCVSL
jgi:PAS domain S-box-containing protein